MGNSEPVYRPCPLCQSRSSSRSWLKKGDLHLAQCSGCSMVFANPVPEPFVSGEHYDRRAESFYLSPAKLESDYAPVRFARELELFRRHCPGGAVLDVGCSTGGFLFQLQSQFPGAYTVLGTDVAGAALDHAARRGIPVIRSPFLEHDFGQARFEAVTFWAVLEHVAFPQRFLEKAVSLLRPGGHGFILVPNLASLAVRVLGAKYRYLMPDHINYFRPDTLERFIRTQSNLEIIQIAFTHFNPAVIWQDFFGGEVPVPDSDRARLLRTTTAWKQNPRLRPLRAAYRALELVLAAWHLTDNVAAVFRK